MAELMLAKGDKSNACMCLQVEPTVGRLPFRTLEATVACVGNHCRAHACKSRQSECLHALASRGRANRRQMATENLGNDESIYSQVVSELMLASRG